MSFASKVIYTGDGVETQFAIPFAFLSSTHINVFVNETLMLSPMNYTLSGSTVTFGDAPEVDAAIEIKRNTSPTALLVDFVDGSVLRAADLDTQYQHNFYLMQEATDSFNELINEILITIASGAGIVETETDAVIVALVNEMLADSAAATLQQRINDIDTNSEAIISLGTDLQVQINTVAQGVAAVVYIQPGEPVPGVGGVPDPIVDGSRWYDSDDNNAPYIYDADLVAWLSIEDPRIGQAVTDISVLQTNVSDNAAAVVTEQTARSNADTAIASDLLLLGAANGTDTAFILDLNTVEIGGGESLSTRFSTITAATDANDAAITNEVIVRSNADTATAATIALMGAENIGQTAFILDTSTVKIDSDGGDTFATRLAALTAADSNNSSSITTIQTVTIPGVQADADAAQSTADGAVTTGNTLLAKYGVTLNVNGYITGFAQNNDGETGTFVILADKFAIVDPSGDPAEPEFVPFAVSGGVVTMQNVTINGSLVLNGTLVGAALAAGTIGSTQIGANAITTTQLNANSVTAAKIVANSVTADKISVTNLAAIDADLGSITAGNITLDSSGYIKGGQTAYNTGTGFFLGYSGAAYKFSIGNGSANTLTWDGSTLRVRGDLNVGEYEADYTYPSIALASTERTTTTTKWNVYERKKTVTIDKPGDVYFNILLRMTSDGGNEYTRPVSCRVYKNDTIIFTYSQTNSSWTAHNDTVTGLVEGDQLHWDITGCEYGYATQIETTGKIKSVDVRAQVVLSPGAVVDLD